MKLIEIHSVHGYIDENGTAQLNLEDISRGLGFTTVATSGNECVRWSRVEGYLNSLGFPQYVGKEFVPENVFYLLSMKASNETAIKFQMKVANEILPQIRKTGSYSITPQFNLPQTYPEALRMLADTTEANQQLELANAYQEQQLKTQAPKVALYDTAMNAGNNFTMMHVAKTLGIGRNKLFDFLRDKKVLMKNNLPYESYVTRGYFEVRQYTITHFTSGLENKTQTLVTPKGMAWIHNLLTTQQEAN